MIAQVLRMEQGVKETTSSGKKITVTVLEYQGAPYKGKQRPPTKRRFFTNNPLHPEIIKLKAGDWVAIECDLNSPYKDITKITKTTAPVAEAPQGGQPAGGEGEQQQIPRGRASGGGYDGDGRMRNSHYPVGMTPKDRAVNLQGCLKVVAQGIGPEKAKDVKALWENGFALYNIVCAFANFGIIPFVEEQVGEGEEVSEELLANINTALVAGVEKPDVFWEWLASKCSEIVVGGDGGEKSIDPRKLLMSHARFLAKNFDAKIVEFNKAVADRQKKEASAVSPPAPPQAEQE